jgi:HK97 gp10 family phage protein
MSIDFRVIEDHLPALIAAMPHKADKIVVKVALDIVAGCQRRSRHKTGQMRGGWRTNKTGELTQTISNPVEHTIYNEFGTVHMSAQPMLVPSVEEQRASFAEAFRVLGEL